MRKRHESRDEAGKNLEETKKKTHLVKLVETKTKKNLIKRSNMEESFNLQGMNVCAKTVTAS